MSSPLVLPDQHNYYMAHTSPPKTGNQYASSPLPSPPLSLARSFKPKLPAIFDRSSTGYFFAPYQSNKQSVEPCIDQHEYDATVNDGFELKPISNTPNAQTQVLPSIQQIVTPSNSPSPKSQTSNVLRKRSSNEFHDSSSCTTRSDSPNSRPSSRKGSIASILNVEDGAKYNESTDNTVKSENDIVIQIYVPETQNANPTAIHAPRGRPPHNISGNRKRRMNTSGSAYNPSTTDTIEQQHTPKRYRSETSNSVYVEESSMTAPLAGQQQQRAVGLRHFSQQVCKKVREKQVTTYNAVADELAADIQNFSDGQYDQKNIRRRVYDALNVLMAMGIIAKDRKEIRWLGLAGIDNPSSKAAAEKLSDKVVEETNVLEKKLQSLQQSVKDKQHLMMHKVKQYTLFRNLIKRNMAVPSHTGGRLSLPLLALACKKKDRKAVTTSSDPTSVTVTGNMTVTNLITDTDIMENMGMHRINLNQYNRWFRSSWRPFCSGLVLNNSK